MVLVLLDMSAAFDTVDHDKLLEILQLYFGIVGLPLKWIESYLKNRKFLVEINGSRSNEYPSEYGVPQGSILGPIFFILYTKHVQHIAHKYGLNVKIYADDTAIYSSIAVDDGSLPHIREKISSCINEMKAWMSSIYLKLNENKTKLLFIRKSRLQNYSIFGIETANGIVMNLWSFLEETQPRCLVSP